MTRKAVFAALSPLVLVMTGLSQESATPTVYPNSLESPSPPASSTPTSTPEIPPSVTATPTPMATMTPAVPRSVRVSFVPPPLEGTISVGVYDLTGKLVRVLHRHASLDAFTVGADALVTKWDGKDDKGNDLPAGKYRAHGYLVGSLQVESMSTDPVGSLPPPGNNNVAVKLMPNPLVKNERPNVEITVGFDNNNSFLCTNDQLPLYPISPRSGITDVVIVKNSEKSVDVWQTSSAAGTELFKISKLDQMMAFDCGAFDLK